MAEGGRVRNRNRVLLFSEKKSSSAPAIVHDIAGQGIDCQSKELRLSSTNVIGVDYYGESSLTLPELSSQVRTLEASARNNPPLPTNLDKLREMARFASTRVRVQMKERRDPFKPLSAQGDFMHSIVQPLFTWFGKNERILESPCFPRVNLQDTSSTIINGASHNYIGFYKSTSESEVLQLLCLEKLPVASARGVTLLEEATNEAIANFFHADFCYTTSTGYRSNYVVFPALVNKPSIIILDKNCHSSMFTGAYLARSSSVRKFAHNNVEHLESILAEVAGRFDQVIVAVEGLYSMDADLPPLDELHRLKKTYDFILFCDEAHSFLSVGKTGRGCLEIWNDEHSDNPLPWDLIDIRTAALSKSIGGMGGLICGKSMFESAIRERVILLSEQGHESLICSTMVQTLWVLGQPTLFELRLHRLADISRFCRAELAQFGLHVYGHAGVQVLPIHVGRPSTASRFSYVLRRLGLLTTPVSVPAVGFWESRIRVNLSAGLENEDVDKLLDAVIYGAQSIGICAKTRRARRSYQYAPPHHRSAENKEEIRRTYKDTQSLIHRTAENWKAGTSTLEDKLTYDASVIEAGHASRIAYGIGAGGARWICGTYSPHLAVEALLAEGTCTEAGLVYSDSQIGLASTIAALTRPLIGYERHFMLIGEDVLTSASDGLLIATKKGRATVIRYTDLAHLLQLIHQFSSEKIKRTYLTVYTYIPDLSTAKLQIPSIIASCSNSKHNPIGMTLLVHSPHLTLNLNQLSATSSVRNIEVLVCGSFYQTFGLPGGYLAGSARLIQELRYTSRGYMFTTAPPPWVLDMVRVVLAKCLIDCEVGARD